MRSDRGKSGCIAIIRKKHKLTASRHAHISFRLGQLDQLHIGQSDKRDGLGFCDGSAQLTLVLDLAFDFEYTAQGVCAQPDSDRNPLRLHAVLLGEFEVGSAKIDGSWTVFLHVYTSDNGELESVRIRFNDSQHPTFDILKDDWELAGLDVSGYDGVNIALDLQIDIKSRLPTANGELINRAYMQPQENRPIADTEGDTVAHLIIQSKSEP